MSNLNSEYLLDLVIVLKFDKLFLSQSEGYRHKIYRTNVFLRSYLNLVSSVQIVYHLCNLIVIAHYLEMLSLVMYRSFFLWQIFHSIFVLVIISMIALLKGVI
ncbi:unnamed protein product [Moneuplotes crassus]|uniref:Uncharacterized protein n=1 Tax=Euplotes crassus TaxID=5936 RepID=A0AAD1XIN8_EUPCR|nr:unnamed protein product [Moneuplotes crassus]